MTSKVSEAAGVTEALGYEQARDELLGLKEIGELAEELEEIEETA